MYNKSPQMGQLLSTEDRVRTGDIIMYRENLYLCCYTARSQYHLYCDLAVPKLIVRPRMLVYLLEDQFPLNFPKKDDCIRLLIFAGRDVQEVYKPNRSKLKRIDYHTYAAAKQPVLFTAHQFLNNSIYKNKLINANGINGYQFKLALKPFRKKLKEVSKQLDNKWITLLTTKGSD
jgi:hypothetical protein